jgi:hypothetical protein
MAFNQFVPLPHPNFQFNRVLTHGKEACREEELWEIAPRLTEFDFMDWYKEWRGLAIWVEGEGRLMHAAYYHRMSEFFLQDGRPEKPNAYQDFRRCFYQAVGAEPFEHFEVPYEGAHLPAMRLSAAQEKGVILLHGGYDSFMEEFYLQVKDMIEKGYTFVVFEGPGQGRTLQEVRK